MKYKIFMLYQLKIKSEINFLKMIKKKFKITIVFWKRIISPLDVKLTNNKIIRNHNYCIIIFFYNNKDRIDQTV